ncbi:Uncharacterised protein [uncultured archaeon]|nr:Uncharacterised protein [uncultured archaeon]
MKKIKNKIEKIIFLIAIFQILLLINLTPAESYTIHQTYSSATDSLVINEGSFGNKLKKLLGIGVNLLVGFLSIDEIGFVSAATLATSCCPSTCNDVVSTFTGCSEELIPTTCANTDECKLGCCFDPVEGLCSTNSPKGICGENGGEWSSDAICSSSKCKKGCCVIGSNAIFTTDQNCAELSSKQGVEKDFRQQIQIERNCLALTASNFEGACVLSGGNCKFESEKQCLYDGGNFHQDYLCSNPELDTKCEKQKTTNCASGKNKIYWFDSCGNRENIYDSDKEKSWNNGKVLTEGESCGGSDGVMSSTSCGNCKQALSTCSQTTGTETHISDGNFVCKDLGCKNAIANVGTQNRVNGEKWCLYDGSIGDGKAVVGSEHWLAYCHNGQVNVERCGDYRGSICQQQKIDDPNIPGGFTTAACVINNPTDCISVTQQYFGKDELTDKCNEKNQCMIRSVSVGSNFKFSMCVPKYPKGNDLTSGQDGNGCALASQSCSEVYEKVCGLTECHWECKANCDCESSTFAKQMNELCMSMGDCGSNVNILGKGTSNGKISGKKGKVLDSDGKETDKSGSSSASAPSVYSWTNYVNNAKSVAGQYVSPGDISDYVAVTFGVNDYSVENFSADMFGWISGATGVLAYSIPGALTTLGFASTAVSAAAPFCYGAMAIAAGMALGAFLGKMFNKSPGVIAALITAGGIAGAGIAVILITAGSTSSSVPVVGWIVGGVLIVIGLIIILWNLFSGNGDRETRYVEYTCQPWTAPNGGDDCEKCNNDPLKPCTAYRCSSLGKLCVLKNENEQNPVCFSLPKETNPPIISTEEVLTEGYNFKNANSEGTEIIKSDGSQQGCIHEFNNILFTLKTDEYAQCKYSFQKPSVPGYDQMVGEYPIEQNLFGKNHTFLFRIPGVDDANVYDLTQQPDENGSIVKYGKLNMYVKCEDAQNPPNYNVKEYMVNFCVNSGPDLTPVSFNEAITNPENNAILKFGATEKDLSFLINEPAECKYDINEGKNYDDMQFSMDCKTEISDAKLGGWPCTTKVENLIPGDNKFYFKCKDMSGNINEEDFVYTLHVSEKELKIDSVNLMYGTQKINFEGDLKSGVEPVSVNVEVKTSGGGYNGKSYCFWGVSPSGNRWMMSPIGDQVVTHNQIVSEIGGSHNIYIDCQDDAGNEVSISGGFTVSVDSLPPVIVRAYRDGATVKVFTDELARCYYNKNNCEFDLNDKAATPMTTSYSKIHTAPWSPGTIYYIRCRDSFGNVASCTGGISPS